MLSVSTLLTNIQIALQSIPEVVDLVDGIDANIAVHDDNGHPLLVIGQMEEPALLIVWQGNEEGNDWVQLTDIFIRHSQPRAMFDAIIRGVVTSDGLRYEVSEIDGNYEQLGCPVFIRGEDEDRTQLCTIRQRWRERFPTTV